jgi:hypothetical protein
LLLACIAAAAAASAAVGRRANENSAVADTKLVLALVLSEEERNVALGHQLEAIFAHLHEGGRGWGREGRGQPQ